MSHFFAGLGTLVPSVPDGQQSNGAFGLFLEAGSATAVLYCTVLYTSPRKDGVE